MTAPVPLLRSEGLTRAGFAHGFSTRAGGVSPSPYESLDFATLRAPDALRENQRRLAAAVPFDPGALYQTHQVHGRAVEIAGGPPARLLERDADALIAEAGTGHAVAVRVADCVPVLVAETRTGRVAAVHAGWRGVELGILAAAFDLLCPGAPAREIVAAVGPCIGPCCFEVGVDVAERIATAAQTDVIERRAGDKAFVDLRRAVRAQLVSLGVADDAIDDVPGTGATGCTRCDAVRFYSYRRDGDASGRLIGVIVAR